MKNMEKMLPEEEKEKVSQRGRSTSQRGSIGHPLANRTHFEKVFGCFIIKLDFIKRIDT